jgi:predicted transposase YbfD/YdcC
LSRPFPPATERQRQSELDVAETRNKGHGRREHRRLQTSTRLAGHGDWPGLAQVCRLDRTTWRKGVETHEVAYAITSAPRSQAKAADVLEWWRGHWGIENRLHWVRDVQFGEDACRVRTGNAPQVLSGVRNAAISLLRSLGHTQIAQTLRENACRVDRLLYRLGILKN